MPRSSTPLSLAIEARTRSEAYDAYRRLGDAVRVRFNQRINALDPRIGMAYTMHLAHNWHRCQTDPDATSQAIIALMARYDRLSMWLSRRADVEFKIVEHRIHLRDREAGRYMWCPGCDAYNAEQKANRQPRLPLRAPRRKAAAARP